MGNPGKRNAQDGDRGFRFRFRIPSVIKYLERRFQKPLRNLVLHRIHNQQNKHNNYKL